MLKTVIEIDNKTASSYSPREFIRRYILQDATILKETKEYVVYDTPQATIKIVKCTQI